jgi:hypothetical protein
MPAGSRQARIDMYSLAHNVAVGAATELISMVCQNGGQISGVIGFYPKGQVPQSRNTPSGQFVLNYEIDRFHEIITTLRYEKPIFVNLTWDANNFITKGSVSTYGVEPIGEQEGV